VGRAEDRFFTFNSGLGLDAEVVRAMQGLRAHGRPVTPTLYMRLTARQFHRQTDRRHPALTIQADERPAIGPAFLCIVSNTTPWTYLGHRALHTNPAAAFDTGLDVFAMRRMPTVGTYLTVARMMRARTRPPRGRFIQTLHDCGRVTLRSERLIAFQVDGEYLGEREAVTFWSVPKALRVVA
jgi:diacylglycerol kinase family enzyme